MSIATLGYTWSPTEGTDKLNEIIAQVNTLTAASTSLNGPTVLHPEYPGVVWSRYSPGTTYYGYGYQDEDDVPDAVNLGSGGRNCYVWTSATGSQELAYGVLRWTLPPHFSSWDSTAAITVELYTTDGTSANELDVAVYQNTTARGSKTSQTSSSTWGSVVFTSANITGGGWSAADVLSVQFTMRASSTNEVRIGTVTLDWDGTL